MKVKLVLKGGSGSGNFDHAGRNIARTVFTDYMQSAGFKFDLDAWHKYERSQRD